MNVIAKILIFLHQFCGCFGMSIDSGHMSNDVSNSEGLSVISTTQSPVVKAMNFLNSADFTMKFSMTEMCQMMHEYSELKKIGKLSGKSDCMRTKLRIEGSENRVECNENPQAENSIMTVENRPKILAIGFADSLCDVPRFNKTIYSQFYRTLEIIMRIVKPEHVPCMEYKLHELKPDSPLIKDYDSSEDFLVQLKCHVFFDTFQSRVIKTLIKQDEAIFEKLNISGCVKINMTEHETMRAYELGIVAMETPEYEVMNEIKSTNFEFKQMFISTMLDCYLNNIYGN